MVVPAYNEERRLPTTLSRLHGYLGDQMFTWEIIVVSNGSTDDTEGLVRRMADTIPNLRLIAIRERGKGIASRVGALQSAGEVVFLCDADLSMPPERLVSFLELIEANDIVVGSREAEGSQRFHEPGHRHLMGRVFNRVVQLVAVRGIRDTQCGFKAFRRETARDLFAQQRITGFAFDVELLYLARKYGYSVEELGIEWYFDEDTRVRPGIDTLRMLTELFLIRLRDATGEYRSQPAKAATRTGDIGG
ncbi:MAG TPA: dolichyl-phosphate beta-glucosyltransferase [Chloroflexota bacterium]